MVTLGTLQRGILRAYRRHKNWRKVAEEYGVNPGTLWDIAHGYEPKTPHLRAKLGLPSLAPAPVCMKCGEVHVKTRCPYSRSPRDLWAMPTDALRWQLEHRTEIGGETHDRTESRIQGSDR